MTINYGIDRSNSIEGAQKPDFRSIGEIIQISNNLSADQVEQILDFQAKNGVKFGEAAVALGFARREDVLWALAQQFNYAYSTAKADKISAELVCATDPFGEAAEIFRDLRSTLMMGVFAQSPRPALAVTSLATGEGKSYFTANLAVSLSQLGLRTVLVDADLRQPRQHELFSVSTRAGGLSAILSGRTEANLVKPIESLHNLFLIHAGTVPPNPLELVQGINFERLMLDLSSKFDYVVVDTPAGQHGADARVISAKCGAALAIGRKNQTSLSEMASFVGLIKKSCKNFVGVVINEH